MEKNLKASIGHLIIYMFLTILAFVTIYPIIYALCGSFKSNMELFNESTRLFSKSPTLENYKKCLDPANGYNLILMFFNSTWFTFCSIMVTLISSSMGAYAFSRLEFRFKKIIFVIFSSLMFFSLGTITIYPLFEILGVFNLDKSLWGLLTVRLFGLSIVNVYFIRSYLSTIPRTIDEAAEVDGCSFFRIYFQVLLPLLKPVLATVGILAFRDSWNEYLMPMLFTLSRPEQRTLMVGLISMRNNLGSSSWTLMLAMTTISLLPVLIVYFVCNNLFVQGITSGAVKG